MPDPHMVPYIPHITCVRPLAATYLRPDPDTRVAGSCRIPTWFPTFLTLNEEDRYVGAVSSMKVAGKIYQIVVRFIGKDPNQLEEWEDRVATEIDQKLRSEGTNETKKSGRSLRHRRPVAVNSNAATANEVAAACGEKLQPTPAQREQKKIIAKKKKDAEKAKEAAKDAIDEDVLKVKRALDFQNDMHGLSDGESSNLSGGDEVNEPDEISSDDDDVMEVETANESSSSCCGHCVELRSAAKNTPARFLSAVTEFLTSPTTNDGIRYLEVLPIPKGVPKCEVSKGSNTFIAIRDKNTLRNDYKGDPSKMAREAFLVLFGREAFENEDVTALGTKKGSKGVPQNVRKAVLGFVNRNKAPEYNALTMTKLNSLINKKKSQVQRTKTSPVQKKKDANKRSSKDLKGDESCHLGASPSKKISQEVSKAGSSSHMSAVSSKEIINNVRQSHQTATRPASNFAQPGTSSNTAPLATPSKQVTNAVGPVAISPPKGNNLSRAPTPKATSPWKVHEMNSTSHRPHMNMGHQYGQFAHSSHAAFNQGPYFGGCYPSNEQGQHYTNPAPQYNSYQQPNNMMSNENPNDLNASCSSFLGNMFTEERRFLNL